MRQATPLSQGTLLAHGEDGPRRLRPIDRGNRAPHRRREAAEAAGAKGKVSGEEGKAGGAAEGGSQARGEDPHEEYKGVAGDQGRATEEGASQGGCRQACREEGRRRREETRPG
ncbi:hypothetical protein GMOD_00006000 [Pyrenophora seminiperda CCB06]|uniref:Uncharacterized protein n=1 Tax=Pyrenophora seminiperda CCB06 TaxID=1302712 RepID=A0A3M7M444_9PLEO|nr:hypothetical protein GMOD_00006000 [Pyrenophora seminiperda CCB06]